MCLCGMQPASAAIRRRCSMCGCACATVPHWAGPLNRPSALHSEPHRPCAAQTLPPPCPVMQLKRIGKGLGTFTFDERLDV